MKGTSIFQFKSWPKIHQPLPRTPRESQQLLNALTSSFRRQLDGAYPASGNHHGRTISNPESSAHATDQHLQNILDNPLFRIIPTRTISQEPTTLQSVEGQRRLAEEPMAVFDQMAAAGSVTTLTINDCLKSQLLLSRSPADMSASRAASRIVDWYWASDGTSRQMLLRLRSVTTSLTKFIVAEGLHGTVMKWLQMLMSHDLGSQNGRMTEGLARQTFNHLLIDFIDAEAYFGNGFGSAMTHYLSVCQMHFQSASSHKSRKPMLLAAGAHLSRMAMEHKPSGEQVPTLVYDQFRDTISVLSPRSLLVASVAVCHPTNPDPRPFLQFVENLSPCKFQAWNETRRDAFFEIGSEALRVLVDRKRFRDISRLEQHISELLPEPATPVAEKSHTSSEEEHLGRLNWSFT
ncbi:unnamed protein product [Penicillium nalgiovense]|uniref:Uncharacterized protein n=1 Tax=Penicillium nalgiovense TaxID=60175 RepID=A0A1V6YFZ2_PENNA|nr:hypothetical protein PENNAL_c0021G07597 [Penicillium nalgiovense]CAG7945430.1 unnamed protein product [Penicillium nalgiovense]CAG7953000.1 unnamed protein product [Penicillium nalgiovense]CAG7967493.1 unnamed protein product [Penicillium nalgiovense]CAG7970562.1 unnamed protein product [Penicillium nalgiovense]